MAYKTLLSVLTQPREVETTLAAAATVAQKMDAHLDVFCLGLDRTQIGYYYAGASAMIYQETLAQAQEDAEALQTAARSWLNKQNLRWSVEPAVAQIGSLTPLVGLRARFADLVVLPKPYGKDKGLDAEAAIEAALFAGQAPVLVVPEKGIDPNFGRRIVAAWNQSNESLVAIRRALPLLKAADLVNIAIIDPPQHGPERSDPGGALCQMLARHGVRTEVSVLARTMPRISDVICRHIRDQNADMAVMGAYGHSRFREAILGGTTRHMLELADVPVFMAH
ncbi:universal stress protein [Plastorhodobacter daqingensis]|uniref:Universal stress protein n=1 Tax=Plastorhodobacter daqingensis TaxID=1387281 RepID=A0ABW2UM18_9RHOB